MNKIRGLIEKLQIHSTQSQLPGSPTSIEKPFEETEINQLLGHASILSLSEEAEDKILTYEIITRLLEVRSGDDSRLLNSAEVIMSRLGNFPGRKLLRERFNFSGEKIPSFLKLECLSREVENSVFIDEESIQLTDFQYNFYSSLQEEKALSVSAPTSAGKSFVLGLNLIRKLREKDGQCIVYIVPTRALIAEVSSRVRDSLRQYKLDDIIIRTAPFAISKEKSQNGVVYVLTQERLMNYLSDTTDEMPIITSLIVDEAHEIQNGKRGMLLQSAIDYLLKKYPRTEVLFASPLIKNPGYFFNVFNISDNGKFFTETISPVSQNIILASDVVGKTKEINFQLLSDRKRIPLGNRTVDFKFRGKKSIQKANLASEISKNDESVIIFANGPSDAESVAKEISETIKNYVPSPDIKLFIDFIRKEIHPDYPLIECLESGVGFHYGKMPSIVRSGIETLFKNDEIKYICCTSTLLQGVNLPAKHIIIENPKSGDSPMTRSDFLNLSGRAGRLLKEFHGNIWCIRPSTWDDSSYEGDNLQEISSAISSVMTDGGSLIQNLLSENVGSGKTIDEAEMAFSKLYQDYHYSENHSSIEVYRTDENSENLDRTISAISQVIVDLPSDIIEKNSGIRPDYLQRLYSFLSMKEHIEDYLLISPYAAGAKRKMENVIDAFIDCFEWDLSESYRNLISHLAYNWIWGKSLGELLEKRVSFVRGRQPSKKASTIIRDYLNVLEHDIRFKMVKYFSAYNDILRVVLTHNGIDVEEIELESYHIYLEFGSCKKEALNIMAMGLSRFTALHLSNVSDAIPESSGIDEYFNKIKAMDVINLKIPSLCKQEILKMQGKSVRLAAANK
ncbi:DEAD/DEAH box helicase [Vreelandella venusta]|nr:DEAD/DEAH box helicase [Halomonas venusta]